MATQTLTSLDSRRPAPAPDGLRRARLAVWSESEGPPHVWQLEGDAGELIDDLFLRASDLSIVPALALRELIENLVHADFRGAVVTILDGGRTLRVGDRGPGVADVERALEPGFTSGSDAGGLIRGVGAGLPTAARLLENHGGSLTLEPNIGGGLVATLSVPPGPDAHEAPPPVVPDSTRALLALILELDESDAAQLSSELGRPLPGVTRELAELEHRGLVTRDSAGRRRLTDAGRDTVTGLF